MCRWAVVGSTVYGEDEKWVLLLEALILTRAEQQLWDWSIHGDTETRSLIPSQQGGGMSCMLTETWGVPKPCLLPLCKQNTNHNQIKTLGRCWGCRIHHPWPASTSGFMHAGTGDSSALHPSSILFPLPQSLLKREKSCWHPCYQKRDTGYTMVGSLLSLGRAHG